MDKTLLKAYIRTIVEEEVKRILPEMLSEAVAEVKALQENKSPSASTAKSKFSRAQLAEMMGLERHGDTIVAKTGNVMAAPPQGMTEDNPVFQAINKDYSALMKKMGLAK
jgi:hypothetical protein